MLITFGGMVDCEQCMLILLGGSEDRSSSRKAMSSTKEIASKNALTVVVESIRMLL